MGIVEFGLAAGALLLTPGPTNTLLALSGASVGLPRALPSVAAELTGYLLAVLAFACLGSSILAAWPVVSHAITLLAAGWVFILALKLWRVPTASARSAVTVRHVFVTTLLNPKALIVGLVLLPPWGEAGFWTGLGLFLILAVVAGILWATGGALIASRNGQPHIPQWANRMAASWLAIVSGTIALGVLHS